MIDYEELSKHIKTEVRDAIADYNALKSRCDELERECERLRAQLKLLDETTSRIIKGSKTALKGEMIKNQKLRDELFYLRNSESWDE